MSRGMGDYVDITGDPYLLDKLPSVSDAFIPLPRGRSAGSVGLGDYDSLQINTGLAGPAVTAETAADARASGARTIMLRPRDGAAPGWPGFFGWLAATNPEFYNYARVSFPNVVEDRQSFTSAGSQLGWIDPASGIPGASDDWNYGDPASELMNGLGATPAPPPDLSNMFTAFGTPSIVPMPQSASEAITDSTPLPTSTLSNNIAATLAQAASAFLPLYQQQQVFAAQLARAKAGLPPLDTSNIIDRNAGFNVGINPATQKTVLTIAAIGAAALLAHKLLGRR